MKSAPIFRIGIGQDIHRFKSSGRLMLGGVEVSNEIGVDAHSDGDVVLHALTDALLGALGLGDIGDRFPNSDPKWKGASSDRFVKSVLDELERSGGSIVNIDVNIQAERPKLGAKKKLIAQKISELANCNFVNVKAGTNEGCDSVGKGEAIQATVIVLISL
ncbi:MAG TPA: 2-C-methyl-D-erythritol 2,4-cyclodiphosphate synthase [Tepidisphaeraceae bacterium]|nr:2-C-methyl-D-erythritol 2,4-cyclodiphosphate synthase [Tepidisphaeraceae bacterium]